MNKQEALERLELEPGATQNEIEPQYHELYNEFNMRITNAPTEHQKKLYQRKLEELEEAYRLLVGEMASDSDLPNISPVEREPVAEKRYEENTEATATGRSEADLKSSLEVLGLQGIPASREELNDLYAALEEALESSLNSPRATIREVASNELSEIKKAYQLISAKLSSEVVRRKVERKVEKKVEKKVEPVTENPAKKDQTNPQRPVQPASPPKQKTVLAEERPKNRYFVSFEDASGRYFKLTLFFTICIPVFIIWLTFFPSSGTSDPYFPDSEQFDLYWKVLSWFYTLWYIYVGLFSWYFFKNQALKYIFSLPYILGLLLWWSRSTDVNEEFDIVVIVSLPFIFMAFFTSVVSFVNMIIFWVRYMSRPAKSTDKAK